MSYDHLHIETDRLLLRPFTLEDIPAAHQMNLDVEVSKYTGDGGVVSLSETQRRIQEDVLGDYEKHGYGRLVVELKGKDKFIGFAGLKFLDDLQEVDLGYRFFKKYWGHGIATEAAAACIDLGFNTLDLNKLVAMVLPENKASIRVLEKLQFNYKKDIIEDGMLAQLYSLNKSPKFSHI